MQIGVLGAGKVGRSLGRAWADVGHDVVMGVRRPPTPRNADTEPRESSLGDAVTASEVIVMAVPGVALDEVLSSVGPSLDGKLVIDATNRIDQSPMNCLHVYDQLARGAVVYRAFNSLGFQVFNEPAFAGIRADHMYCGPDSPRRRIVETLIEDMGLSPVYVGDLDHVYVLEACTVVYFALAKLYGRHVAIKILHDDGLAPSNRPSTANDGGML